ncbi:MAG TPA: glycosyltransferase family 2 protein [Candidatus Binataceae bacterium]|nr:glycosyltransferase family 2 protein [Candidatus Binataceae bacterium]
MSNPRFSIVIPCYNEEGNLSVLFERIGNAIGTLGVSYEVVVTDDCSTDSSWRLLQEMANADPRIRVQRLAYNCGESAAVWAGIRAARGDYIITMDADLQNDPGEIPRFVQALEHFDCVSGSRVQTRGRGDNILRVITSRVGNGVRNWLSGDQISDSGCTYRAFKRECAENLVPFSGMHRFMPTLIKMEGYRVGEIPIVNHPRHAGHSHYGFWNRLIFLQDLLAVRWMKKRKIRYEIAQCVEAPQANASARR